MADDQKLIFEFALDEKQIRDAFAKLEGQAADSSKKLKDVLNFDPLSFVKEAVLGIDVAFATIGLAAVATGVIIKEAFDLTLEGEKINAVRVQFDNLAESVGLVGSELKESLEKSAGGLIDTTSLLKTANGAIIELGSNAAKLPQVLEVTRKITAALGGSLEERFAEVTRGIETANARMLRSQGVVIDQQKAFRDYASAIGLTSSELTKAQQQQAILNAFLDQAGNKFKNVQGGLIENNLNVKKIGVAFTELTEDFDLFLNSVLGSKFAAATGAIANFLKQVVELEKPKTTFEKQTEQAANYKAQIISLGYQIQNLTNENEKLGDGFFDSRKKLDNTDLIEKLRFQLIETQKLFDQTAKATTQTSELIAKSAKEAAEKQGDAVTKLTAEQLAAIRARDNQILGLQIKAQSDFIGIQEAQLPLIEDVRQQIRTVEDIDNQKRVILEEQFELARKEIADKYSKEKGFTEAQRNSALLSLQLDYANKRVAAEVALQVKLKELTAKTQVDIKAILLSNLNSTFQGVGAALAQGKNVFDAFGKGILALLGDIAIQIGNAFLTVGFGVDAIKASIVGLAGGPAIAAGLALITLGGLLKSLSSGNTGSDTGGGGGSGGGVAASPTSGGSFTPTETQKPETPGQSVQVVVQGNILDRRQTGLELAEVIRESFQQQGTTIVGAV